MNIALPLVLLHLALGGLYSSFAVALPSGDVGKRVKRVIGGFEIEEGDWKWLIHLKGKVPKDTFFGFPILPYTTYYCGGSLINKRWVLTAAHCFNQDGYNRLVGVPKYWHAKAGEVTAESHFYDRILHIIGRVTGIDDLETWVLHAEKIFIHPNYDEDDSWANDIALIKLEDDFPVEEDPNIDTVKLQETCSSTWPPVGATCVMKGWGCSASGGGVENNAHAVELPLVSDTTCRGTYHVTTETRMCAGRRLEDKGICKGDSGGPLVCDLSGEWVQVGLASFTSLHNPEDYPSVFTKVCSYNRWIKNVMQNN